MERLKREPGRDVYVFGSAELMAGLAALGAIDEYRVCIAPVVLGAGTPLFKPARAARRSTSSSRGASTPAR